MLKKLIVKKHLPFWLLAILFGSLYFLPYIFAPGMHADGVCYATISRNLSEGKGTLWSPFFSETFFPGFYEHPPLVFGIQSIFFRIFGDHLFVEKFYCLMCFIICGWLLSRIWFLVTDDKANMWLPFIFWVSISQVTFTYANNFLENTMGIFCYCACCLLLLFFLNGKNRTWLVLISSLMIFLGCLCKGPFALFPLAMPGIYWLVFRKPGIKTAILVTLSLVLILFACFSLLFVWPSARHDLQTYFTTQLYSSLAGKRGSAGGRFFLFNTLIYKLKPIYITTPVILLLGAILIRNKEVTPGFRFALFFLLMGLSINIAMLVSAKQLEQYELCAYAFYAMAGAALIFQYINFCIKKFVNPSNLVYKISIVLLFMGIIVALWFDFTNKDQFAVDRDVVNDVRTLKPFLQKNRVMSFCSNIDDQWALKAALYRQYHISISTYQEKDTLFASPNCLQSLPQGYKPIAAGAKYILLVKRK